MNLILGKHIQEAISSTLYVDSIIFSKRSKEREISSKSLKSRFNQNSIKKKQVSSAQKTQNSNKCKTQILSS